MVIIDSILSRYNGSPSENKTNNNDLASSSRSTVHKLIGDAVADAMRSSQLSQIRAATPNEKSHISYNNEAYNTLSALQAHLNTLEVKHNTYESNTTRKLFDLQLRIDKLEQIQNSNISDIQKKISERVDRDTSSNMFSRSGDVSSGRLLNELNNRLEMLERKILRDKRLANLDFESFENNINRNYSFDNNNDENNFNNNDGIPNFMKSANSGRSANNNSNNYMNSAEKIIERRHYPWLVGNKLI